MKIKMGKNLEEAEDKKAKFEVWTEGYICTGAKVGATFHGVFEGNTFKEAVKKAFKGKNESEASYYGCRVFDNEKDARKAFG